MDSIKALPFISIVSKLTDESFNLDINTILYNIINELYIYIIIYVYLIICRKAFLFLVRG